LIFILKFIYEIGLFVRKALELLFDEIAYISRKFYVSFRKRIIPIVEKIKPALIRFIHKIERFRKWFSAKAFKFLTGHEITEFEFPLDEAQRRKINKFIIGHTVYYSAPLIAIVVFFTLIFSVKDYTLGVKVYIDNQEVAVLKNQAQYQEILRKVENYVTSVSGETYKSDIQPQFQVALANKKSFDNTETLEKMLLSNASDVIVESYGLYIDGELIAANDDKALLEEQLQAILEKNRSPNAVEERLEFVQDVKIEKSILPKKMVKTAAEISDILNSQVVKAEKYKVQKGDLMIYIADKFNMSVSELQSLNPDVNPTRLREGMELTVSKPVSLLSVKVVRTVEYEKEIPYSVEKKKTGDLYKSQSKISVKGQNGIEKIKDEVFVIDGVEVSRMQISREVVKNPVTQVELTGTKALPAKVATGSLRYPVRGTISSRYGVRRGSRAHTGVDIACKRGTPIVAADGGTVTFAGRSGSYGLIVKISHGNGVETWYAHCSAILVSVGQKVAKGEVIAKVGSTGNSTGPHLHLEYRVNGVTKNPLNYLS